MIFPTPSFLSLYLTMSEQRNVEECRRPIVKTTRVQYSPRMERLIGVWSMELIGLVATHVNAHDIVYILDHNLGLFSI